MNLYNVKFYDENRDIRTSKIKADGCVPSGDKTVFYALTSNGKKQVIWEYLTLHVLENVIVELDSKH